MFRHALVAVAVLLFVLGSFGQNLSVNEKASRLELTADTQPKLWLQIHNRASIELIADSVVTFIAPDGAVRATATIRSALHPGNNAVPVTIPLKPEQLPVGEQNQLLWFRLQYQVKNGNSVPVAGVLSVGQITPQLFEIKVAALQGMLPGTTYTARVRAEHPLTTAPQADVAIVGELFSGREAAAPLKAHAVTNRLGEATLTFSIPQDFRPTMMDGSLKVSGSRAGIQREATLDLRYNLGDWTIISTDKPIYQPGQVLHVRGLLRSMAKKPVVNEPITLKITDPDDIVVYREELKTSRFGIAHADWEIPDNQRLGDYRINMLPASAENEDMGSDIRVKISRYDLPQFVVTVTPDRAYYLSGQNAKVKIRGDYLFGKPLPRGHVRLVREEGRHWDYREQKYESEEAEKWEGELGAGGEVEVPIDLTEKHKEMKEDNWSRFKDYSYAAYITDPTTGRTEPRRFDLRISREAIHVYAIAMEAVYPDLPSQFYISTQYPDGTPARTELTLGIGPSARRDESVKVKTVLRSLHTDQNGLVRVDRLPIPSTESYSDELVIEAKDTKGLTGTDDESVYTAKGEAIRVTTNKALYRDGESIGATVESNRPGLRLVAAAVHDHEVIWSEQIRLLGKKGYFTVPYHSKFKDEITLVAYNFDEPDSQGWRGPNGSRTVLFPHEHGLKLGLQLDRAVYRPGDDAEAAIHVKGVEGRGAESALGIAVSDKAVEARARTEEDFGRGHRRDSWGYEWADPTSIGGRTRADLDVIDWSKPLTDEQDLVAEVLLASANNQFESMPGFEDSREYAHDLGDLFQKELLRDVGPAMAALNRHRDRTNEYPNNPEQLFKALEEEGTPWAQLRDPWGHAFTPRFDTEKQWESIRAHSAGPDGVLDNDDDSDTEVIRWQYFHATGEKIDAALRDYHLRTGLYITDPKSYFSELKRAGINLEAMRDRWGSSFVPQITVEGRYHVLKLVSPGPNRKLEGLNYWSDDFPVWETRIDYFAEQEIKMQKALNDYWLHAGKLPKNDTEAREALKALPELKDFWGHDLYFDSRDYSYYSDHVETVASTTAAGGTEQHTVAVPVSTKVWVVDIFSRGPNGIRGDGDDFRISSFLKTISEQSGHDVAAKLTASPVVVANRGNLAGVVVDSSGAVIGGAKVTINGPSGDKSDVTNQDGQFLFQLLVPGFYNIRVEKGSFKEAFIRAVEVLSEKTSNVRVGMVAGQASEIVEVSASAITVNTTSSTVASNPSFSGTGALAKGATGLFYTRGGFEAQYGKSRGGAVQIVTKSGGNEPPVSTPRLREYFPETLLWAPEVITDKGGRVSIRFKVADNITTWNISVMASTADGQLGTVTKTFRAFQPFFAELDPPKALTLNDEISLPIVARNFLPQTQSVTVDMATADWFQLLGKNPQTIQVAANDAQNAVFPFRTTRFLREAHQRVTATATDASDAVERTIYVHPDGEERSVTVGSLLAADKTLAISLPDDAFPGTQRTEIKIYPNLLAHVTESIEGILERPYGCGEQTISSTFPSLLLLKAEKQLGQSSDRDATARLFLQSGYNRLLSYRDSSGGFTYWGHGEPDVALTAYALRFLREASEFIKVDESAIADAQTWLISQQSKQGEWHDSAVLSAYVERILGGSPNQGKTLSDAIEAAMTRLAERAKQDDDPYFIGSYALAAQDSGKKAEADAAVRKLRALMHAQGEEAFWELQRNTPFYGWGHAGRIESTALAVRAIFNSNRKAGAEDPDVARGLQFLLHEKDRYGVWYSGQTTINVLDTLLEMLAPVGSLENGAIKVIVNGEETGSITMPAAEKASSPITLDISSHVKPGENRIQLTRPGGAISSVQAVSTFYVPWASSPAAPVTNQRESDSDRLRLEVRYDKTEAKIGELVTAHVEVERIGHRGYGMLLAEIGLPPGSDVDRASLDKAIVDQGWGIDHYDLLPDRLVVYLWPRGGPTIFNFSFRERYGIRAKTAPSSVYDYYNPDIRAIVQPTLFAVQ